MLKWVGILFCIHINMLYNNGYNLNDYKMYNVVIMIKLYEQEIILYNN